MHNNHKNSPEIDAILLCGGKGRRLEALTGDQIPKSLFKVNGRELISYSLDAIDSSSVNKVIFAVDHHAEAMKEWIDDNQDLPCSYTFSEQPTPGICAAVKSALAQTESDKIAICNTDEIRTGFVIEDLLEAHRHLGVWATMLSTYSDNLYRHRVLNIHDDIVVDSKLKSKEYLDTPEVVGPVNTGFIIFQREVLELIDLDQEADWGNLIDPLVQRRRMGAFVVENLNYFNVGTCEEFIEAENFVAKETSSAGILQPF